MRVFNKRALSLVLAIALCISLLSGLALNASASTVTYVTGNPSSKYQNVIKNWGTRGTTATFLSPNAIDFYSENNVTYADLAALSGSSSISSVPSSALYKKLHQLVTDNQTKQTSYDDTKPLCAYTDIQDNGNGANFKISSFYSGKLIGPSWDGGSTWNREHTWPNSKGNANGNGENDIMMLRPASVSENSSRGNTAYGESSGYYDPNTASGGTYNLHGDVARIMLYVYTRWGTANMWGSGGVIESKDVLLKWMLEDPVDTWEMGRNDSVESITGTRNVYVDYPELAFCLLGAEVPQMTTPSGEAAGSGTVIPTTPTDPTAPTVPSGPTYVTTPVAHTAYKFGMVQENVNTSDIYYLAGGMSGYYMATTTSQTDAIDVYLEATNGGYHLYTKSGDTKQYINMVVSGTHVNGAYETAPSSVYTFDGQTATLVSNVDGTLYRFGTRNDKSYTTVGPVKVDLGNFYCHLYSNAADPTDPTDPEQTQPTEPAYTEISITEAIAWGTELEHNVYTTEKYLVTGTISQIESESYGNMYLTDGNGNYLYVYGTYDATGDIRYDAMEVKPVAGDTVTILGAVGNFSGAAQMKSGWIVAHTIGEPPVTEPSEEPDASISFADVANRLSQTTAQQVWQQNGITVTNDKADSSSNVTDYSNPVRFYKSSKLTIAAEDMVKIDVHCNSAAYATALKDSITDTDVTVTQDTTTVSITFANAIDTFVIEKLSAQIRVNSIDIYVATGDLTCDDIGHTWVEYEAVAPTATTDGNIAYQQCSVCGAAQTAGENPIPLSKDGWILAATGYEDGWQKIDGNWYYYKNNEKQTGWQMVNNAWYYMDAEGVMQTGWEKVNNTWYYLGTSGAMQTGWQNINGAWYYLGTSGAMQTGWLKLGNTWYYLNANGAMATGWVKVGTTWYYMGSSGAMVTGWQKISGVWYYMNASGAMVTGWQKINGVWYYMNTSGAMVTGSVVINGKTYHFASNGVWIP